MTNKSTIDIDGNEWIGEAPGVLEDAPKNLGEGFKRGPGRPRLPDAERRTTHAPLKLCLNDRERAMVIELKGDKSAGALFRELLEKAYQGRVQR